MTTITVRMDTQLKQDLQAKAKQLGLSLNQLINLKMRELNQQQTLTVNMQDNWEIERFSDEETTDLLASENIQNNMQKMNNILKNI